MTSNIIQLTVSGGSAPTPNIVTGNVNFVHCAGDDIILDASTTSGSPQSFATPSMEFNSRAHQHQPLPTPSLQER